MKKKTSRFVQRQRYNQHLQNKSISNMNRNINKTNKKIEQYTEDYNKSINELMDNFIKENGLDPNNIPNNSRILIYELLKKNLINKREEYSKYIQEHSDDENIIEYYNAQKLCNDSLEQIDWIYDWKIPIEDSKYDLGEGYGSLMDEANEKLKASEKKFDDLSNVLESINTTDRSYKDQLRYDFYRFCNFIIKNDTDKYYIYISNTIKNLLVLDKGDPIADFMTKHYISNEITEECEG